MLANVLTSASSWDSEHQLLTYIVPAELEETIRIGQLVAVPYGERLVEGLTWELYEEALEVDPDPDPDPSSHGRDKSGPYNLSNKLLGDSTSDLSPSVGAAIHCARPSLTAVDAYHCAHSSLTVVDAYCGVGTFALLLARHVGKVIAIEESASAIKDAQWNARDVDNIEILKGKVEDILPTLTTSRIDGFIIDPPRAGCQRTVLDALIQHPVARIVYVSCDPSTLARDLHILCHQHPTYRLCSVQPLDMFPQTAHIECIAVLEHVQG